MKLLLKRSYPNGTAYYLNERGNLHRLDGPAVKHANGHNDWYLDGKRHRIGGPAIVWSNGKVEYWENNRKRRPPL